MPDCKTVNNYSLVEKQKSLINSRLLEFASFRKAKDREPPKAPKVDPNKLELKELYVVQLYSNKFLHIPKSSVDFSNMTQKTKDIKCAVLFVQHAARSAIPRTHRYQLYQLLDQEQVGHHSIDDGLHVCEVCTVHN